MMKIEKHRISTKRGKRIEGKHKEHKNNHMDNLSDKQLSLTEASIMVAQEQVTRPIK